MRVHIDKIGPEGFDFDEVVGVDWVNEALGSGSTFRCTGEGRLTAHLERIDGAVHVRGHAVLPFQSACSRCLEAVSLVLDTPIQVTLFPKGEEPAAAPDGELSSDDMGIGAYEGEEIDLSSVLHDEVLLELPMISLCADSCAGLCSSCGHNLNEGPCGCEPQTDPRWEALRGIKPS